MLDRDAKVYGLQMSLNSSDLDIEGGVLAIQQANLAQDVDGYSNISWGQTDPVISESRRRAVYYL